MSVGHSDQVTKDETPPELFDAIGNKVSAIGDTADGDNSADGEIPPVDEIESLCMNCGKNVSRPRLQLPLS